MSSVNSTSDGASYYPSVREIKEENDRELERVKNRASQQVDSLVEGQNKTVLKVKAGQERAIEEAKLSAKKDADTQARFHEQEVRGLKEKIYDRSGKTGAPGDVEKENQRMLGEIEKNKISEQARMRRREDQQDNALARNTENYSRKVSSEGAILRDSHNKEMSDVLGYNRHISTEYENIKKDSAAERARVIQETEGEYKNERDRLIDNYESTLGATKRRGNNQLETLQESNSARNREARQEAAADQHQIRLEGELEKSSRIQDHQKQVNGLIANQDLERKNIQTANELRIANMAEVQQETLQNQSETFQKHQKDHNQNMEARFQNLKSKTDDDRAKVETGSYIPPQVEDKIRAGVVKQYQRQLESEKASSLARIEGVQDRASEDRQKLTEQLSEREAGLRKTYIGGDQREKQELTNQLKEAQMDKQQTVMRSRQEGDERTLRLKRDMDMRVSELSKDTRASDQENRDVSNLKLRRTTQDLELQSRQQHREFAFKQSDLVRDYESRLKDQREESEFTLKEKKNEFERFKRDSERTLRTSMEDQAKSYEVQIGQMKNQQVEKERVLNGRFDSELEKLRKLNQRLMKRSEDLG